MQLPSNQLLFTSPGPTMMLVAYLLSWITDKDTMRYNHGTNLVKPRPTWFGKRRKGGRPSSLLYLHLATQTSALKHAPGQCQETLPDSFGAIGCHSAIQQLNRGLCGGE